MRKTNAVNDHDPITIADDILLPADPDNIIVVLKIGRAHV